LDGVPASAGEVGAFVGASIDARAGTAHVRSITDRQAAIAAAIAAAREGDVVVIAGKGHEQGQELAGGHTVPFDDVTVAREALRARRTSVAGATA
jgi:UDP-N-acetylmuramyl tripeptide synthase